VSEACAARDALAKAIYGRLFDHIVARINAAIPFQASVAYIGILDIAGFGSFHDYFLAPSATRPPNREIMCCRIFHGKQLRTILHKLFKRETTTVLQ
jgi:hypothetical protein